jgi:lysylphosphatidylglycerol synthetase-like protein (DUF2156 family)
MLRTRLALATLVAGSLLLASATSTSADNQNRQSKGKNAPEVPATAQLPVVAVLGGATLYVLSRGVRRVRTASAAAEIEAGTE